jgi:hypothetical protein
MTHIEMTDDSRRKARAARLMPVDHSYSIDEFCQAERISRSLYYKLRRLGQGPREMTMGRAKRISSEARAEWRRAREQETTAV